jgi:hypothetical protein
MMASAALCSRLRSSPSVTIPLRALACRRDPAEPASGTHRGHQRRRLCVLGIGLRMAVRARARETRGVGGHSGQHPPGLGKLPTRHELARRIREGARQGSTVPTRPELVQRKE